MLLSWGLKLYEGNFIPDIVIRKFSRKIAHDRFGTQKAPLHVHLVFFLLGFPASDHVI
jgi:hypothetical protein